MKEERKILRTARTILRPWRADDAAYLYELARDPRVGTAAGWPPHTDIEESREVIRTVFSGPETYAVELVETGRTAGCIGLLAPYEANFAIGPSEMELGYWLGVTFWGRGLIPEAAREIIRHGFADLHLTAILAGYYEGNLRSKRVMEKCGFTDLRTECSAQGDGPATHIMILRGTIQER